MAMVFNTMMIFVTENIHIHILISILIVYLAMQKNIEDQIINNNAKIAIYFKLID